MEDISFEEIWSILKRRWWVVITFTVVGAMLAGIFAYKVQSARYIAYTTLVAGVQNDEGAFSSSGFTADQELVPTIAQLLRSRSVQTNTLKQVFGNASSMSDSARISVVYAAPMIQIAVEAESEPLAAHIANQAVTVLAQRVSALYPHIEVRVIDPAVAYRGASPVFPHRHREVEFGGAIGLMLGLLLVLLLEKCCSSAGHGGSTSFDIPVLGVLVGRRNGRP